MEVKIKSISLSDNNTSTSQARDKLTIDMSPVSVTVKNSISKKELVYTLNLTTKSYSSIVEKNGLLRVSGNKIVNKNGVPVSFAGNSFFWSNNGWGGDKFYNASVVSWLKLDWETTLIRASMGVDETGGYIQFKTANTDKVKTLVDAAISNGLYVLIDWHSHHAEDYQPEAIEFFTEMATLYGNTDNVIYEIYNEPLDISWSSTLKPYAEAVITAIRAVYPDNMIVVGTPEWSQQVDKPAADPITISSNIAYALHFYSVYHKQWLRDRATAALNSGIAIFATEWGSLGYTQNDPEAQLWMEWCRTNKISHCNWAVNDKAEEWSVVKPGASVTGGWQELTEAGYLARDIIRAWEQ
ncbi:MAG: glycoside hydrolase family 5 protein [Bacteroidales bacterium]|nr:glycoside hydrolase family 5 protein [Bacteroidales bacterium]